MKFGKMAALAATVLGLSPGVASGQESKSTRPNVIMIVADDLGATDLSSYGYPSAIPTPNIDRIAARGVKFTRGYSTASVCSPSRAGLLTGQYQQRFGFEYLTGFNMTEVSTPLMTDMNAPPDGSCGWPRTGMHCRLVDGNDIAVPPGSIGELIVRTHR